MHQLSKTMNAHAVLRNCLRDSPFNGNAQRGNWAFIKRHQDSTRAEDGERELIKMSRIFYGSADEEPFGLRERIVFILDGIDPARNFRERFVGRISGSKWFFKLNAGKWRFPIKIDCYDLENFSLGSWEIPQPNIIISKLKTFRPKKGQTSIFKVFLIAHNPMSSRNCSSHFHNNKFNFLFCVHEKLSREMWTMKQFQK